MEAFIVDAAAIREGARAEAQAQAEAEDKARRDTALRGKRY